MSERSVDKTMGQGAPEKLRVTISCRAVTARISSGFAFSLKRERWAHFYSGQSLQGYPPRLKDAVYVARMKYWNDFVATSRMHNEFNLIPIPSTPPSSDRMGPRVAMASYASKSRYCGLWSANYMEQTATSAKTCQRSPSKPVAEPSVKFSVPPEVSNMVRARGRLYGWKARIVSFLAAVTLCGFKLRIKVSFFSYVGFSC